MKLPHFRNEEVRDRLWEGIRKWRDSSVDHQLREPSPGWRGMGSIVFWVLVTGSIFYNVSRVGIDHVTYLLGVGLLALPMTGTWMGVRDRWQFTDVTTVVPLSNGQLRRQMVREVVFLKLGLMAVAGMGGWLFLEALPVWERAAKTALGCLGVSGLLVSLLWLVPWTWLSKLTWVFLVFVIARVFHGGFSETSSEWLEQHKWMHFWEGGKAGWLRCGVLLAAGAASILYWFRKGTITMPLDRHLLCELDGLDPELLDLVEPAPPRTKTPREPIGILEGVLWRFLSPEERSIARVSGFCQSNYLKHFVLSIGFLIGAMLLVISGSFDDGPYRTIPVIAISAYVFSMISTKGKPLALQQIGRVEIGPRAHVGAFQIYRMSFAALKSLMWKEALLRVPLAAFVGTWIVLLISSGVSRDGFTIPSWAIWMFGVFVIEGWLLANLTFWNGALSCVAGKPVSFIQVYGLGGALCFGAVILPMAFLVIPFYWMSRVWIGFELLMVLMIIPVFLSWLGKKAAQAKLREPASDFVKSL